MTTGKKLVMLREEKGLKQKEAAEALNLPPNTLSNYENDKREMDYDTQKLIANFYNVSVDWLIGKSEYRNEEELLEQAYFNKLQTKFGATEKDIKLALDFIKRAKADLDNK